MAQFDLHQHLLNVSALLQAQYNVASAYGHKTGRGDMREDAFVEWLREFLPRNVQVTKGEIADSNGRRSREFDAIVYTPSGAPRLFSYPGRSVVPIEEVLAVIEVKSDLQPSYVDGFSDALRDLADFDRFYRWTATHKAVDQINGKMTPKGFSVKAGSSANGIRSIVGGFFAYEAATSPTVDTYFTKVRPLPLASQFGFLFVLSRALWAPAGGGSWTKFERGPESIVLLAGIALDAANDPERWAHVLVDNEKYLLLAAQAGATAPVGTPGSGGPTSANAPAQGQQSP